jgi:hypothetical protein
MISAQLACKIRLMFRGSPFVLRVHALINLIHHAEGCSCQTLHGHEVVNGGNRSLTTRLAVRVENA